MKTRTKTDLAKFFCGFETFHAIVTAWFWINGAELTAFGVTWLSSWGLYGAIFHAGVAIA